MPEKGITEVARDLRDLYQKGNTALQRQNFDYAIAILTQVLQREPAFFEARQALRAAQFKKHGTGGGFFKKMIGGASSQPAIAKGQMTVRKNPIEALRIAEEILTSDPNSTGAHKLVAEAALAADMPRTACLSLEILLKDNARDFDLSMQYGEALTRARQVPKAEAVYTELLRLFPHKGEVATALKDLSAQTTLSEGGYDALADGTGSYRDVLKNKDEAVQLEQEHRTVKSEDVAERLIAEYEAQLQREPNNLKRLRDVAELYTQKKQYDRALQYYERIRGTEGGDSSIERAIADTTLRRFNHLLENLDQSAPDYAEQLAALQKEKDTWELAECQKRVENYPTDLQIRFDLGQLFLKNKRITEAIQEFQKAQNNPARRLASMGCLAQCFAARGMNDLAARKLQEALKEKPGFDDEKKDLIYQLGCVLEKMGKADEAIEQFKQIYEADIGYKDVAAKVDAYYASQG